MYFVLRDGHYHEATDVTFRQFMNGALSKRIPGVEPNIGQSRTNHLDAVPGRAAQALSRNAWRGRWPVAAVDGLARLLGRVAL